MKCKGFVVVLGCSLVAALVVPASSRVSAHGGAGTRAAGCVGFCARANAALGRTGRAWGTAVVCGMEADETVLRIRGGSDDVDYYQVRDFGLAW
jgi:hypothetical protein